MNRHQFSMDLLKRDIKFDDLVAIMKAKAELDWGDLQRIIDVAEQVQLAAMLVQNDLKNSR